MADCHLLWCSTCYWLVRGTEDIQLHAGCGVVHALLGGAPGPGSRGRGTRRESSSAPPQAPQGDTTVAARYRDALETAGLPHGHVVDFGSGVLHLVFAGLEPDKRKAKKIRNGGSLVVTGDVAPAVVCFVKLGGAAVVACGCSHQAHNETLLDVVVSGCAAAAGRPGAAPPVTFTTLHAAQAGLASASAVPGDSCAHACYASATVLGGDLSTERALPLPGSPLGMVVATGGGSWCALKTCTMGVSDLPLTVHTTTQGRYNISLRGVNLVLRRPLINQSCAQSTLNLVLRRPLINQSCAQAATNQSILCSEHPQSCAQVATNESILCSEHP